MPNDSLPSASDSPRNPTRAQPYRPRIWRALFAVFTDPYRLLLLVGMGIYTRIFAGLAIAQHAGMRTHKADLGQIDQAIWNSSRGRFVEMTDFGFLATRMTDHVEPVLAYISPIYWFWDDPRAILILQTVFVALGAWVLYHLALRYFLATLAPAERDKIWHTDALLGLARPVALSLALAYLLAPPLQAAVLTEFHAVPLVVPMVLWALWAVVAQRWVQFAVAVFLVATVKEETALLAAGLGVWALWRVAILPRLQRASAARGPALLAAALTVASLLWFYVATFVIVPAHAAPVYGLAESSYFARYGALGDSPADILRSFFTRPGLVWSIATEPVRLDYLRRLLMPFGYLSLLAPDVLLLSLPVLLANQLSAYPAQYYGEYHYSAPVIVYFAAAAALGAARLWRLVARGTRAASASYQHMPAASSLSMNLIAALSNARTALRPLVALGMALWFLVSGVLSYVDAGRGPWGPRLDATPVTAHHRLLPRFVDQIPAAAPVSATAAVHPHVSHRRFVYQFPLGLDAPTPPDQRATWALLDVTMAVDMAPGDLRARVEAMLAADWGVVDAADGILLLHTGAPTKTIPPAFYSFARAEPSSEEPSDTALTLAAGDRIDRPYWRATQIVSTWQVGTDYDPAIHAPRLALHAPNGDVVVEDLNATAPARVWLPPQIWQPGDRVRITTLPHYLPRYWGVVAHESSGPRLVSAWQRGAIDRLHALPTGDTSSDTSSDTGDPAALAASLGLTHATHATFGSPEHGPIQMRAWTPAAVAWGRPVNVLLAWEPAGRAWPQELSVFVHLRADESNQAQADGAPRYFLPNNNNANPIWDWRQLNMAEATELAGIDSASDANAYAWRLVVGLYNPTTGERVPWVAAGNSGAELDLGTLQWADPPPPDQTCALIPATCASQAD